MSSTSLLEKLFDTRELIEKYHNYQNKKSQLNEFEKYNEELIELKDKINEYNKMLSLLADYNLKIYSNINLKEEIEVINNNINTGELTNKNKLNEIYNKVDKKEDYLKESWKNYVESIRTDLFNTLRVINNLFDDKRKINNIITVVKDMKRKWPFSESELRNFEKKVEEAKKLIDNLEFKDDVRTFLRKVSFGKATVEDLNEDILKWIKENNFENNLSIKFK